MPRAPARFTQADMARAIKAMVQACGGARVEIARDGTIRILPGLALDESAAPPADAPLPETEGANEWDEVLL